MLRRVGCKIHQKVSTHLEARALRSELKGAALRDMFNELRLSQGSDTQLRLANVGDIQRNL